MNAGEFGGDYRLTKGGTCRQARRTTVQVGKLHALEPRVLLSASPLVMKNLTIHPVVNQLYRGTLATFSETSNGVTAANFTASIQWFDGTQEKAVIQGHNGTYSIIGSHLFTALGSSNNTVSLTRLDDSAQANGITVAITTEISGRLSASSDTGISQTDGITNVNQPFFSGQAVPGSTVQVFVQWYGENNPIMIGQGLTNSSGNWQSQSIPLTDGVYNVLLRTVSPTGDVSALAPLSGTPTVVIDTVGPVISGGYVNRRDRQVTLYFRDNLSGTANETLSNASNFNIIGTGFDWAVSNKTNSNTGILTIDKSYANVSLSFSQMPVGSVIKGVRVLSGGVTDVAGNAMDGKFSGRFPTGNGRPGGIFYWKFRPGVKVRK